MKMKFLSVLFLSALLFFSFGGRCQNLIPNHEFNLGQTGRVPYCTQQRIINKYLIDWKRAIPKGRIGCIGVNECPTPDWTSHDCAQWHNHIYPYIEGNKWIHNSGADLPYQDGMRVGLTSALTAGATYTLTYWVLTFSGSQQGEHKFKVYLSNLEGCWDCSLVWKKLVKIAVYKEEILDFDAWNQSEIVPSPFLPVANHWHQERVEFTVPSDLTGSAESLDNIIFISRVGGHHFDAPILTPGGCDDPLIIDNTTFRPGVHHPYYGTPIEIGYNGMVTSEEATLTFVSPVEVQINAVNVPGNEAFHVYNAPCDCESPVANPGSAAIICANDPPYQLGGPTQQWMTYEWSCEPSSGLDYLSSTTVSDPILTPPTVGSHQLVYTITVTNTCGESFSEEVPIVIVNTPDNTPELSANFYTTEWPVTIEVQPDPMMETISIELYNYGGSTPTQTWSLQAYQDFQPGEQFEWAFPDVLPICDGYTIKVKGKNMCSDVWSNEETVTVEPFGGTGVIEQLSNVVSMSSPPPNNSITLIHTGFVSYRLRVFTGHSGLKIHDVTRPIVSNTVALWDGLNNEIDGSTVEFAVTNGTYMFILDLTDCDGNVNNQASFWTVLNSSNKMADPEEEEIEVENLESETIPFQNDILIIPNPNSGTFTIIGTAMQQITIMDASGKLVKQLNAANGNSIEVSGLGAGLYIVRVQMSDGSVEIDRVVVAP